MTSASDKNGHQLLAGRLAQIPAVLAHMLARPPALMQRLGTDQVNWPGKGRDDLLCGFCPDA